MTAKRWFELECRHCGQRFIDMAKLLFHRCPSQGDVHSGRRKGDRRPGQANPRTKTQGLSRSAESAR